MFNVKRRDNPSMDKYMHSKNPSFGGPSEKTDFDTTKRETLKNYQRVIDRNADFEGGNFNHNYDPTWKAITRDLISRTAKKKPFDPMYAKPTIATVDAVEEGKIKRFQEFVNESEDSNMFADADDDAMAGGDELPTDQIVDEEPEVDEEQLQTLMDEFGDDLQELIDSIAENMEIEKEEVGPLLRAAIKKLCNPEEEEEEPEEDMDEIPGDSVENPDEID